MKEELNMSGTDFNVCVPFMHNHIPDLSLLLQKINTIFTCGYIIGMIPSKFELIMALW